MILAMSMSLEYRGKCSIDAISSHSRSVVTTVRGRVSAVASADSSSTAVVSASVTASANTELERSMKEPAQELKFL